MQKVMSSLKRKEGTEIYDHLEIAGSVSTGTKVGKPNEYDFNLPLNVDVCNIKTKGSIRYGFDQTDNWYNVSQSCSFYPPPNSRVFKKCSNFLSI